MRLDTDPLPHTHTLPWYLRLPHHEVVELTSLTIPIDHFPNPAKNSICAKSLEKEPFYFPHSFFQLSL